MPNSDDDNNIQRATTGQGSSRSRGGRKRGGAAPKKPAAARRSHSTHRVQSSSPAPSSTTNTTAATDPNKKSPLRQAYLAAASTSKEVDSVGRRGTLDRLSAEQLVAKAKSKLPLGAAVTQPAPSEPRSSDKSRKFTTTTTQQLAAIHSQQPTAKQLNFDSLLSNLGDLAGAITKASELLNRLKLVKTAVELFTDSLPANGVLSQVQKTALQYIAEIRKNPEKLHAITVEPTQFIKLLDGQELDLDDDGNNLPDISEATKNLSNKKLKGTATGLVKLLDNMVSQVDELKPERAIDDTVLRQLVENAVVHDAGYSAAGLIAQLATDMTDTAELLQRILEQNKKLKELKKAVIKFKDGLAEQTAEELDNDNQPQFSEHQRTQLRWLFAIFSNIRHKPELWAQIINDPKKLSALHSLITANAGDDVAQFATVLGLDSEQGPAPVDASDQQLVALLNYMIHFIGGSINNLGDRLPLPEVNELESDSDTDRNQRIKRLLLDNRDDIQGIEELLDETKDEDSSSSWTSDSESTSTSTSDSSDSDNIDGRADNKSEQQRQGRGHRSRLRSETVRVDSGAGTNGKKGQPIVVKVKIHNHMPEPGSGRSQTTQETGKKQTARKGRHPGGNDDGNKKSSNKSRLKRPKEISRDSNGNASFTGSYATLTETDKETVDPIKQPKSGSGNNSSNDTSSVTTTELMSHSGSDSVTDTDLDAKKKTSASHKNKKKSQDQLPNLAMVLFGNLKKDSEEVYTLKSATDDAEKNNDNAINDKDKNLIPAGNIEKVQQAITQLKFVNEATAGVYNFNSLFEPKKNSFSLRKQIILDEKPLTEEEVKQIHKDGRGIILRTDDGHDISVYVSPDNRTIRTTISKEQAALIENETPEQNAVRLAHIAMLMVFNVAAKAEILTITFDSDIVKAAAALFALKLKGLDINDTDFNLKNDQDYIEHVQINKMTCGNKNGIRFLQEFKSEHEEDYVKAESIVDAQWNFLQGKNELCSLKRRAGEWRNRLIGAANNGAGATTRKSTNSIKSTGGPQSPATNENNPNNNRLNANGTKSQDHASESDADIVLFDPKTDDNQERQIDCLDNTSRSPILAH